MGDRLWFTKRQLHQYFIVTQTSVGKTKALILDQSQIQKLINL